MKQIDDLVREVKKEYPDITMDKLHDIIRSQFLFVAHTIEKGEFNNIILPYWGKFFITEKKKTYWTNKLKEEKQDAIKVEGNL